MPRNTVCARPGRDRESLYSEITGKIIAELEAGRVPWVQPWGGPDVCAGLGLPQNAATQRRYSGINILILWGAVTGRGFSSQNWLTFRQALGLRAETRVGVIEATTVTILWEGCRSAVAHRQPEAQGADVDTETSPSLPHSGGVSMLISYSGLSYIAVSA